MLPQFAAPFRTPAYISEPARICFVYVRWRADSPLAIGEACARRSASIFSALLEVRDAEGKQGGIRASLSIERNPMNPSFTGKRNGLCAACALTLGFAFAPAQAGDIEPGAQIWKNPRGDWCWNRAFLPAAPPSDCDPSLFGQSVAATPAPAFVAAPAASVQAQYVAPAPAPALQAQYVAPVQAQPIAVLPERPRKQDRN